MDDIRIMRYRLGMNQKDLAREMAVSQATICEWESGRASPKIDRIPRLAALLGVTSDEIIAAITASKKEA